MNSNQPFRFMARAFAACATLAAAATALAQTPDLIVNNFDTEDEGFSWTRWWGGAPQAYEVDFAVDADNNASSGSLRATIDFDLASFGGDNQFAFVGPFPENATIDGSQYTNLVFDLRWDPNAPKTPGGDFGFLEVGFRRADFSQTWVSQASVPASAGDGWTRMVLPISPAAAGIDQITGITFKMWSGDANNGFTGSTVFWIDNIYLEGRTDTTVPEPTMFLSKAEPGLRIYASGSGQYQRQNIRTLDPSQSWVGATEPVTYSFTVGDYPDAAHSGFQTHLFLVPGSVPNFEGSPDWNQPNVIFFDLQNTAEGTANATFRYKTNSANGNTMYYNSNPENGAVGALASIGAENIRGTWKLTFSNDTSVTITTPSGSSTNFALPTESAALFADPLYAYLGIQPNSLGNLGQSARFTSFSTVGTLNPLTESFAGVVPDPEANPDAAPDLDSAIWERVAENAAGIVIVPTDAAYAVEWTVPAIGFQLQRADNLTTAEWSDVSANASQIGDRVRATVSASGSQGFYRLVKP